MNDQFKNKYLKYKSKYFKLKDLIGGMYKPIIEDNRQQCPGTGRYYHPDDPECNLVIPCGDSNPGLKHNACPDEIIL